MITIEQNMKEIERMIFKMVLELKSGRMDQDMRASMHQEKKMVKALMCEAMGQSIMGLGRKIELMDM